MPANENFHRTAVNEESFIRGAARLLWAGTTISFPSKIGDVINLSTFEAQTGWNDLGATKNGITISINNSEEEFDVDQILGAIASEPTEWECSVGTQLAEFTVERMQIAWEGSAVSVDAVNQEREVGFGQPTSYTQRRLAVLFQRPNGKVRGYFFRKVQRTPQESTITHNKTGEQISIPVQWKSLADASIAEVRKRFFIVRDQI
jgi:hypothetical protein